MTRNVAIILSGGSGSRMECDIPKQYLKIHGKMIISYSLECFVCNKHIDGLIIAIDPKWKRILEDETNSFDIPIHFAISGESRQYTIFNALKVAEMFYAPSDIVIIHDAARPLLTDVLIDECINVCQKYDGAMPVLPMKDTIYESYDGLSISSVLNRDILFAGQAPEAFKLGKYINACKSMNREELLLVRGSAEIAYKAGMKVKLIKGDERNFKVTVPEDLVRLKLLLEK